MVTATSPEAEVPGSGSPLLHLLHLASPTLPIGAYAYSQALEVAVAEGWVGTAEATARWILDLLDQVQSRVDVPLLARTYRAWSVGDAGEAHTLSASLLAQRESRELQDEDVALGRTLARLLRDLGVEHANALARSSSPSLACAFSLAAVHWSIPLRDAASGYLFAWIESQVSAATRLIPLGQTAAQRVLVACLAKVPRAVELGLALEDAEIGASAPGLAIASAAHESLYTRLFRS